MRTRSKRLGKQAKAMKSKQAKRKKSCALSSQEAPRSPGESARLLHSSCLGVSSHISHAIDAKKGGESAELGGSLGRCNVSGPPQPQQKDKNEEQTQERDRERESIIKSAPQPQPVRRAGLKCLAVAIPPSRCRIQTVPDRNAARRKGENGPGRTRGALFPIIVAARGQKSKKKKKTHCIVRRCSAERRGALRLRRAAERQRPRRRCRAREDRGSSAEDVERSHGTWMKKEGAREKEMKEVKKRKNESLKASRATKEKLVAISLSSPLHTLNKKKSLPFLSTPTGRASEGLSLSAPLSLSVPGRWIMMLAASASSGVEGLVAGAAGGEEGSSSPPLSPGTLAAIAAVSDLKEFEREQREELRLQEQEARARREAAAAAAAGGAAPSGAVRCALEQQSEHLRRHLRGREEAEAEAEGGGGVGGGRGGAFSVLTYLAAVTGTGSDEEEEEEEEEEESGSEDEGGGAAGGGASSGAARQPPAAAAATPSSLALLAGRRLTDAERAEIEAADAAFVAAASRIYFTDERAPSSASAAAGGDGGVEEEEEEK